ncbi:4-hydroxy-tetrahydrodipicolinate reductase [Lacisediminihabitans sp.]|uniref:4-hydroxy-tetrahydrodipicolinate reductase n=1 Tax=Lacisediminihabitans sp. TaxID=2787631 RepID=UPI00374DAFB8
MTIRVAVVGATGRMGRLVCRLIEESADLELVARIGSTGDLAELLTADIAVDVTLPAVSEGIVAFAVANGVSILVGTSGWSSQRIAALETRVAEQNRTGIDPVGVIIVPNFSIGSVLATSFAAMAARFYDSIEIIETHHATKVDSPSGTAVRTAELIGAARSALGPVIAPHADQRARGQQVASVPIHSLRMQGVVARQDVVFGGRGETLTLSHETLDPSSYEAGILLALSALPGTEGVVVGLDRLIDLARVEAEAVTSVPPEDQRPEGAQPE